jgi:hypothetical protein
MPYRYSGGALTMLDAMELANETRTVLIPIVVNPVEPTKKHAARKKSVSHRGKRSQYSQKERDATVKEWLSIGEDSGTTLLGFLCEKFGEKDSDSFSPKPIVAKSTFYMWRKDFVKRHPNYKPRKKNN